MSYLENPFSEQIRAIKTKLKNVKGRLKECSDNNRAPRLKAELKELKSMLQAQENEFKAWADDPDPLPKLRNPKVFQFEVIQGLHGYQLIAGKDTLVRIFLGRTIPKHKASTNAAFPFDTFPVLNQSRVDTAILDIEGPDGVEFSTYVNIEGGQVTNTSLSYAPDDNANFYLDGRLLAQDGSYKFTARFFRDGDFIGAVPIGSRTFHPTRDLRVLFVVSSRGLPSDALPVFFEALKEIQRTFPIRAGIGPLDGDQTMGLRYKLEVTPFETGWPEWAPMRQRLTDFNAEQQANGRPDRVDHIFSIGIQLDGEMNLGGTADSGPNGTVAGAVLNTAEKFKFTFGTLLSHELGHNHLATPHTENEEIDSNRGFDMVQRVTRLVPREMMFGTYSDTPNGTGFYNPQQWQKIREVLLTKNSTGTNN